VEHKYNMSEYRPNYSIVGPKNEPKNGGLYCIYEQEFYSLLNAATYHPKEIFLNNM